MDWYNIKWFLRGFFWMRPIPHNIAYRCWSAGAGLSTAATIITFIAVVLAAIFFAGRASD